MLRLVFTEAECQTLQEERYHHPRPRVQRKMEVLWLKSQGLAHQDMARLAGVGPKTARGYLHAYARGGIAALTELRFHRPQNALVKHRGTMERYFREHPPHSIAEAVAKTAELTGITRSPTQVRAFMKKCGMTRLKTGVLSAKADIEAQAEFKKNSWNPV